MTVTKLRKVLSDNKIPKTNYSIGKPKENAYCIEEINGLWAFYTVERGKKYGCKVFLNFNEASEWLITRLLAKQFSE